MAATTPSSVTKTLASATVPKALGPSSRAKMRRMVKESRRFVHLSAATHATPRTLRARRFS
jgi:hypothetical protein